MKTIKKVAIYGGGIGGLSAAHELSRLPEHRERYEVHVYEAAASLGGKARSQLLEGTGTGGRKDLPGEHGFRFFPAFYQHLEETLKEIPRPEGGKVWENLRRSEDFAIARSGKPLLTVPRRQPIPGNRLSEAVIALKLWGIRLGLGWHDLWLFVRAVLRFLVACPERRIEQFEATTFAEFCQLKKGTLAYEQLMNALPRTMVAMQGDMGNAYTIGNVGLQLFFLDPWRRPDRVDQVLNGPTTSRWIDPWVAHLARMGVVFHTSHRLEGLDVAQDRVIAARITGPDGPTRVEADHHIAAVPLEVCQALIARDPRLAEASPSLSKIQEMGLAVDWMVGAQYFLRRDVPICKGHVIYADSPWALTSISQAQFWQGTGRENFSDAFGDGEVKGILSVDICGWDTESPLLGRTAKDCTKEEILDEVFRQVCAGLEQTGPGRLSPDDVLFRHLDESVRFRPLDAKERPGLPDGNDAPLLVHPVGSWKCRPNAADGDLVNLFYAADYVQTYTNLASMEGANEAARAAVGAILRKDGDPTPGRERHPFEGVGGLEALRKLDAALWREGGKELEVMGIFQNTGTHQAFTRAYKTLGIAIEQVALPFRDVPRELLTARPSPELLEACGQVDKRFLAADGDIEELILGLQPLTPSDDDPDSSKE